MYIKRYVVTRDADMLAPDWLAVRINYTSIKFVYHQIDGAEKLKGVRIGDETAEIGDAILFDDKRLSVERRRSNISHRRGMTGYRKDDAI